MSHQDHALIKRGQPVSVAELDAGVALTRAPVTLHPARVLAQPVISKVDVTAKLCTPDGLALTKVPSRSKADDARARRRRWGDAVMPEH